MESSKWKINLEFELTTFTSKGPKMNCASCTQESKVLDSRPTKFSIRRRRACVSCGKKWTTYETPVDLQPVLDNLKIRLRSIETELVSIADSLTTFSTFLKPTEGKRRKQIPRPAIYRRRPFSEEEKSHVRELYPKLGATILGIRLSRNAEVIRRLAKQLGLTPPKAEHVRNLTDGSA